MKRKLFAGLALALVAAVVLSGCAPFPFDGPVSGQGPFGYGPGGVRGPGMMGGSWGGYGPGMMGGTRGYYAAPNGSAITIDQAADAARLYLRPYGENLVLGEVMEFTRNYYAEVEEKDTGIHAMELLIDKYTGGVSPEVGPNMMWNTKYSHMGGMMGYYGNGSATTAMPIGPDQAIALAREYLDSSMPGLTVAGADTFYGYYTLHTLKDGQTEGMLSVNGYTGAVWYHSWHGAFLGMEEYD